VSLLQNASPVTGDAAPEQVEKLQSELATSQRELEELRAKPDQEALQAELATAHQEMEELRARAQIAASISNIPNDESKPIAEQVAAQVELLRADLQTKHDERVRAAEETYQKRADMMKKQLSTKLATAKQTLTEQLRDQIKAEHAQEIDQLKRKHEEEIARIKKETIGTSSEAAAPPVSEVTDSTPQEEKKLSQPEIKDLIANDPLVKNMLARNVQVKVDQQKEAWSIQVKQEEEKVWIAKLEEANKNAESAKDKAVTAAKEMEGKRMSVKMNMATNKASMALAKIEVVEKAATDTPQRPVGEVWAIAKDTKPAPAVARPAPTPAASTSSQLAGGPTVGATPQAQVQQGPSTPTQSNMPPRQQANTQQQPQIPPVQDHSIAGNRGPTSFGQPSIPPNPFAGQAANQQQNRRGSGPNHNHQASTGPGQHQQQQNVNAQARGIPQPATGTGPAVLRSLVGNNPGPQNSGIPRPGAQQRGGLPRPAQNHQQQQQQGNVSIAGAAGAGRGASGLPRGGQQNRGGRGGGGRGNNQQHIQASGLPQAPNGRNNDASNSPRGGMNPGARQFVPGGPGGQKRPHDGHGDNNAEKKFKGGSEGGP
jgi:nucleoprotein TPR